MVYHIYSMGVVSKSGKAAWAGMVRRKSVDGVETQRYAGVAEGVTSQAEIDLIALAATVEKVPGEGHDLVIHSALWNIVGLVHDRAGLRRRILARNMDAGNRVLRALDGHEAFVSQHAREEDYEVFAELHLELSRVLEGGTPETTREGRPRFALE